MPTELAEWYRVQRWTIYSRLTRSDIDESLEHATIDAKQTDERQKVLKILGIFKDTMHESLSKVGFVAPTGTPAHVQQYP